MQAMSCFTPVPAQSVDQNFISAYRNTSPSTAVAEHRYFDGLGRLVEKVSEDLSPENGVDLVETVSYDGFGRVSKKGMKLCMPGNAGKYCTPGQSDCIANYKEPFAYVEFGYEDSPLERQLSERGPGAAWIMQGKSRTTSYLCNSQTSHLGCLNFTYEDGNVVNKSYYPDGALAVVMSQDEDGRRLYEFRDGEDRLLLSRKVLAGVDVDTYYVYDVCGDLCAVLPPGAVGRLSSPGSYSCAADDAILQYAYLYEYDALHRCVSKKFPGADAIIIKYDESDRPIYQQTGLQRAANLFTRMDYDKFNRLVYQTDGSLVIRNYYDTYDSIPRIASLKYVPKAGYGAKAGNVKTLKTGSAVTAGGSQLLYTICYYDNKGQLIQKRSQNILGGYDAYYYLRTYTGNVGKMLHEHVTEDTKHEEILCYGYDQADRLVEVSHQFDGGPIVVLRHNDYDRLCRLESQNVFEREVVGYAYNIRDWTTGISSRNFKETLSYYDGKDKQFAGNISTMAWCASSDSTSRKYEFMYDGLSRLLSASYSENGSANKHYDTEYSYDLMGNMLSLRRNGLQDGGTFGEIDNVSFMYNGNQMVNASNRVESPTYKDAWYFSDGASEMMEYEYDENGNLERDKNKGISKIKYNSLNLPTEIMFGGFKTIRYVYDALGTKLKAIYRTIFSQTERITAYCDNMIYEDGELKQVLVDGGYISFDNGKAVYHYFLKDHLGSNRVVVNYDSGDVEQVNHYYPYGELMAESTGGSVQRFKYNGKELDRMHGLDWYDYGARWYDGNRFLVVDPHVEKYSDVSPYVYCGNNPLNSIDFTGMDSYYLTNGTYLFDNLKESDKIYIVNKYKKIKDISTDVQLVELYGKSALAESSLTAEAYSNILTDVLKRNGFDTSKLENGHISVNVLDSNIKGDGPTYQVNEQYNNPFDAPWKDAWVAKTAVKGENVNITANIVLPDTENRDYYSSVSNIVSVLGVHELTGHGLLGMRANEHWKILEMQRNHPSWNKVTKKLKELYFYLEKNRSSEYLKP